MPYYDLCLKTADPQALAMAKTLGFSGVGVLVEFRQGAFGEISDLRKNGYPLEVTFGIELRKNVKPLAKDMRRNSELIAARGEDREAVETPEVDVVFPQELNYIMARLAKKNNVAIGFEFAPLLHASKKGREETLTRYFLMAKLVRKYKLPFLLTSGAQSPWDLRSPSDLIAFGKVLGFNEQQARDALSGKILAENRKRLGKGWVMPGVEVE